MLSVHVGCDSSASGKGPRGTCTPQRFGCFDDESPPDDDPRYCHLRPLHAGNSTTFIFSCSISLLHMILNVPFYHDFLLFYSLCLVQPHGQGKMRPRSLRELTKQYLGLTIQDGEHDPVRATYTIVFNVVHTTTCNSFLISFYNIGYRCENGNAFISPTKKNMGKLLPPVV